MNNRKLFFYIVGVLIIFFIGKELIGYWDEIEFDKLSINYIVLLSSFFLLFLYYVFLSYIWINIVRDLGQESNILKGITIHTVSQAAKYLPGGIWNMMGRIYICSKQKMNTFLVATSVFFEIFFNLIGCFFILLLTGFSLLQLDYYIIVSISIIIILFFIRPAWFLAPVRLLYKKIKKEDIDINISSGLAIKWSALYAFSWVLYGTSFYFLIYALNITEVTFQSALGILIISWAVGYLSPVPGGIGVREGSMTLLLSQLVSYPEALMISLYSRLWLTLLEVVLYAIALLINNQLKYNLFSKKVAEEGN